MAARRKAKKRALPRLTILAYSRVELERFSYAAEIVSSATLSLINLTTKLEDLVGRLEALAATSQRPRRARKAAPTEVDPVVDTDPQYVPGREGDGN